MPSIERQYVWSLVITSMVQVMSVHTPVTSPVSSRGPPAFKFLLLLACTMITWHISVWEKVNIVVMLNASLWAAPHICHHCHDMVFGPWSAYSSCKSPWCNLSSLQIAVQKAASRQMLIHHMTLNITGIASFVSRPPTSSRQTGDFLYK